MAIENNPVTAGLRDGGRRRHNTLSASPPWRCSGPAPGSGARALVELVEGFLGLLEVGVHRERLLVLGARLVAALGVLEHLAEPPVRGLERRVVLAPGSGLEVAA